ncbi:MAG: 30S ribosome-binding factor RbfA, partial [bacterium]|nr:30S ribosome-binding factor RbfA [bacterium]
MSQYRIERLKAQFKAELSDIIQGSMKDPRLGFATITSVEVSGDYRHVKVYVSVLGSQDKQKATLEALESATGYLRTEV